MNPEMPDKPVASNMFDNPIIRLQFISYEHGFTPESKRELGETFTLLGYNSIPLGYNSIPGKAAKHLNNVLRHQIKHGVEEPLRAVRSIAREYVSYLITSYKSIEYYQEMSLKLASMDGGRRMTSVEATRPYWPIAAKLIDLDNLLEREQFPENDEIHIYNGIDYFSSEDDLVLEKINQTMHHTRISKARRLANLAIDRQIRRNSFWTDVCQQSMDHYGARPIVKEGLSALRSMQYSAKMPDGFDDLGKPAE